MEEIKKIQQIYQSRGTLYLYMGNRRQQHLIIWGGRDPFNQIQSGSSWWYHDGGQVADFVRHGFWRPLFQQGGGGGGDDGDDSDSDMGMRRTFGTWEFETLNYNVVGKKFNGDNIIAQWSNLHDLWKRMIKKQVITYSGRNRVQP